MKNILLLGGFGFIGTNLLKHIDERYPQVYSVVVVDKLPVHPYGVSFDCVEKSHAGDFSDGEFLKSVFESRRFDVVIHAASTTVPTDSANARFDIESNLIPTIDLLNLMSRSMVKDIIFLSSGGAIYGESQKKHKETDDVFPKSSYGVVKLAIEKYLFQYASLYGLRPLVLRLSNVYGRYHYSSRQGVCNIALRAALCSSPFEVWGTGESRKDYIFVDDAVSILFRLYEQSVHSRVINVGSGTIMSVREILSEIRDLIPDFKWSTADASAYDVQHFELDTALLGSLIGEYKFTPFKKGLRDVLNWYKKVLEPARLEQGFIECFKDYYGDTRSV